MTFNWLLDCELPDTVETLRHIAGCLERQAKSLRSRANELEKTSQTENRALMLEDETVTR